MVGVFLESTKRGQIMGMVADALRKHLEAYKVASDKQLAAMQMENDLLKAQLKILKGSQ